MYGIAECVNILGAFCGRRDLPSLTPDGVKKATGSDKADVLVLFGGSIMAGGDLFASAIRDHIARRYVIVGGAGHTTGTLRRKVHEEYPDIDTEGLPEAEVFNAYIGSVYGVEADLLETASTNCGNNITNLIEILDKNDIPYNSVILCQDATMQLRMYAGMKKYAPSVNVLNYAAYSAHVAEKDGLLRYTDEIHGMWDIPRYINLLLGEIPRLRDDGNGYGPKGKGFIAHVDIPAAVENAYRELTEVYGYGTREADPSFASKR